MTPKLLNRRIAILATDGFEQSELQGPMHLLEEAGAVTNIVSPEAGSIQGMKHADKGDEFEVDLTLTQANPADFDALVIPGGLLNPDALRANPHAIAFVKAFAAAEKPIAAICHGPWLLIEAGLVKGRRLTSWPAIKTDVRNAGGSWVDEDAVLDRGVITSRNPDDVPAFTNALIELLARTVTSPSRMHAVD